MLNKAFRQNTKENRLTRLVLVFALVFASVHVALHDLEVTGGGLNSHGECQACRLNHVPIADSATPLLFEPLQFLLYIIPVVATAYQLLPQFRTQRARAPPLY